MLNLHPKNVVINKTGRQAISHSSFIGNQVFTFEVKLYMNNKQNEATKDYIGNFIDVAF